MSFKRIKKIANYYAIKYRSKFKKLAQDDADAAKEFNSFIEWTAHYVSEKLDQLVEKELGRHYTQEELDNKRGLAEFIFDAMSKNVHIDHTGMSRDLSDEFIDFVKKMRKEHPEASEKDVASEFVDSCYDSFNYSPTYDSDFEHQNTEEDYDKDLMKPEY